MRVTLAAHAPYLHPYTEEEYLGIHITNTGGHPFCYAYCKRDSPAFQKLVPLLAPWNAGRDIAPNVILRLKHSATISQTHCFEILDLVSGNWVKPSSPDSP